MENKTATLRWIRFCEIMFWAVALAVIKSWPGAGVITLLVYAMDITVQKALDAEEEYLNMLTDDAHYVRRED